MLVVTFVDKKRKLLRISVGNIFVFFLSILGKSLYVSREDIRDRWSTRWQNEITPSFPVVRVGRGLPRGSTCS